VRAALAAAVQIHEQQPGGRYPYDYLQYRIHIHNSNSFGEILATGRWCELGKNNRRVFCGKFVSALTVFYRQWGDGAL
jgi:hypothetical protein